MRWGYTARSWHASRVGHAAGPIRHAWDGLPANRPGARIHAICGAALVGLGPQREYFDPAHPRVCDRCIEHSDDA